MEVSKSKRQEATCGGRNDVGTQTTQRPAASSTARTPAIAKSMGLPTIEELYDIYQWYNPILLESSSGGNATVWTIKFNANTPDCDSNAVKDAIKSMKPTIIEHSYMHTLQLKFHFSLILTTTVLQNDPVTMYLADLCEMDEILENQIEQLMEQLQAYDELCKRTNDDLVQLDTNITSIDPLRAFKNIVW